MADLLARAAALCLGMLCLAGAMPAAAGPLAIAPTTVQVAPGRHSAVVEVENVGDAPADLQFRAYAWSQAQGRDVLTPTGDVVVSPAIVTVAAHAKQLFRVLQVGPDPGPGEHSYRLRLNELPHAVKDAVGVNLEFLLPMFMGSGQPSPSLGWSVAGDSLSLINGGTRRVKITALALRGPDGAQTSLPVAMPTYLLGGSQHRWQLPGGRPPPAGTHLVGTTEDGPFDVPSTVLASRS